MFTSIQIKDFRKPGVLNLVVPEPMGWTDFHGRSGAGKTAVLASPTFALLGTKPNGKAIDDDWIGEGSDDCQVSLTTRAGTTLTRRRTRKGDVRRVMSRPEGEQTFPTDESLAAKLGPLLANRDVTRMVLVPLAWKALADTQLGRPLRDLLMSILPPMDLRKQIGEMLAESKHTLKASDPVEEKGVKALQSAANADVIAKKASLDTLSAQLKAAPTEEMVATANQVLDTLKVWESYDTGKREADRMNESYTAATARHADWTDRKAALGVRPEAPATSALSELQSRVVRGKSLIADAERSHTALTVALAKHIEAKAHAAGGKCPTCGHAIKAAPEAVADIDASITKTEADIATSAARITKSKATLAEVEAQITKITEDGAAARAWDASFAALGREPSIPTMPTMPTEPTALRPLAAQVEAARTTLADARSAASTVAAVEKATKAHAASVEEQARVVALVQASRQAPTILMRRQTEAMGDLGPVSLRFPPKENQLTPEIEVLYNGRSVDCASSGEMVITDLWLRAMFRRLGKVPTLPIPVDNAQDWSGEWPAIAGPVWRMWTEDCDMEVR